MKKLFLWFIEPLHAALFSYMVRTGLIACATDTILNISMITNESLMILENQLTFADQVTREYDDSFGIDGAKIGDTLNVRRPPRFVGTTGPNLSLEDYNQTSVPVVLGDTTKYGAQFHVDVSFTTKDLRLALGAFSENVAKPAIAAVANKIDYDGLQMAKNTTANIVGTPGTAPNSLLTYLTAGAILDAEAAPRDGKRSIVLEPFTSATIIDSLKGLFNPQTAVSEQYKKGLMGRDSVGVDWRLDQNVANHTFGSWATTVGTLTADTTGAFTGSISTGWASTSTITLTNSQTITLNKGDVISIANVLPVNPQSRQVYGTQAKKFVVTTTATAAGGTVAVTVSPAIITGGQFQNCSVTSTSATATVTPYNIAGTTATAQVSPQNIMLHKNAFTLAMADLPLPGGVVEAARASSKEAGMSIRVVRQYTINNDQIPARFDVLYGWAPLYAELACRIAA
jgi:hypothetical protein